MDIWQHIKRKLGYRNWDASYKNGNAPWDTGVVSEELKKTITEIGLNNGKALELGCGTGINAIYLAQKGFETVGVDYSKVALKTATERAAGQNLNLEFYQVKMPALNNAAPGFEKRRFDLVFDRGCFHTMPKRKRKKYAKAAGDALRQGGHFLLLCGNAKEPKKPGPPVLTEQEIRDAFGQYFQFDWIRDFRFNVNIDGGALGYSVHMIKI